MDRGLSRRKPGARSGFTLIEILVSVSIIALLIALLVPALRDSRGAAGSVTCQSRLRQWAVAVMIYAQNHAGFLPRRGQGVQEVAVIDRPDDWFNALPPLLGEPSYQALALRGAVPRPGARSISMCPAAEDVAGAHFFAYGMNMRLSTWNALEPDRIDHVAPPNVQAFLADAPGRYCSVLPSARPYSPIARHQKGVNIAFLDGHAAHFTGDYVGCGIGDPLRPDVQWVVPNSPWPGPSP